jgi:DNA-directed RNA polymerase specialized sigma24 family protein
MNKNFEDLLKSTDILKIMVSVGSRYAKNIDPDQLESIKMGVLWDCQKKYDPNRGAKFTSFLYQQLNFAFKNELKKKRKEFSTENMDNNTPDYDRGQELEILDGIPSHMAILLRQRYVYNMTMVEIGKENGYSRETARRKLASALDFYKNKNQIEV